MNKRHIGIIVGAILFLAIAMGIGRFSFTPMLPFLRQAEGLSVQTGSWIATGNYIGYLIGALWAGRVVKNQKVVLGFNVALCILSLLGMGMTTTFIIWFLLRILSGITGGFIFVLTSSMLMDYLANHQLGKWSGYTFSGIGLGILISGLCVPYFVQLHDWHTAYFGLTIISVIFMSITLFFWRKLKAQPHRAAHEQQKVMKGFMIWLTLAYGLEGMGYIITGTFLVDIVYEIPLLRPYAGFSWVIVGLGAIPSAPLWMWLMTTFKAITIIRLAYILQIIGLVLPVISMNVFTVTLSALLFGSTFVGLVAMSTGYGRQLYPKQSGSVVSVLTSFYALGQIIGPILAARIVYYFASYNAALLFAACIIFFALLILQFGIYRQRKFDKKTHEVI
ncbi:MAG: YbfB/YjiJ family MFS transporter [Kurthia sp.]|nr:YbfB/YjiJ family MFS transporter [Candidatus Kurthia equi]